MLNSPVCLLADSKSPTKSGTSSSSPLAARPEMIKIDFKLGIFS